MSTVRATKHFTFELAHALTGHGGLCAHLHGHSYVLDVTVEGTPRREPGGLADGMVIDFADLKRIVRTLVVDHYDHALVLHEAEREGLPVGRPLFARVRFTPWQPTCENLLLDIVARIGPALPPAVALHHVRLQETATSWTEWGDGRHVGSEGLTKVTRPH